MVYKNSSTRPLLLSLIGLYLQLIRVFNRVRRASVKGSLFLLQKAPSILPLSLFSYEVNGSGALLARFDKKKSVSNQQLKE